MSSLTDAQIAAQKGKERGKVGQHDFKDHYGFSTAELKDTEISNMSDEDFEVLWQK